MSKLLFAHCGLTDAEGTEIVPLSDLVLNIESNIIGVDPGDDVVATLNDGNRCFLPTAHAGNDRVVISLSNTCGGSSSVG